MNYKPLFTHIINQYQLELYGIHGPFHWLRVCENGLRLSQLTGADLEVVQLFSLFHDSRRFTEGSDWDHGCRGAKLMEELRGQLFDIDDKRFELLYDAIDLHTGGTEHPDITVLTCWDADRLDLGRVGVVPNPDLLCTEPARRTSTIDWALKRSDCDFVPIDLAAQWGFDCQRRPE